MRRDIEQRAKETMPFLTFDHDPYLAVTDEGYVWIMDAYTTSDAYPYSQAVNMAEVTAELLPRQEVNYIRNSVKAVVDAYDRQGHVLRRPRRADHAGVGPRVPRRLHLDRPGA